jgi:tRNA dimethylallyltransferase
MGDGAMGSGKLVVIAGPTGSGKKDVALRIGLDLGGEVISADSRKVYKFMDIGTSKPTGETLRKIPWHLIDVVPPDKIFTAADFKSMAEKIIEEIHKRGRIPFVVGGTGLYIRALIDGLFPSPGPSQGIRATLLQKMEEFGLPYLYEELRKVDPEEALRIDPHNPRRIIRALEVYYQTGRPISYLKKFHTNSKGYRVAMVGITMERRRLYDRIDQRVDRMIDMGLVDEVKEIVHRYGERVPSMDGVGYRQVIRYLKGEYGLDEAIRLIKRDTRRLAKRQLTWFRKDSRLRWFLPEETDKIRDYIMEALG